MEKIKNINYLPEMVLSSELTLFNHSKLLQTQPELFNDAYLKELEELRKEYIILDQKQGLQKEKKILRDKIRDLSSKTYVQRDPNIFGEMIMLIIDNIIKTPRFNGYTFVNEMKSLATEHILKYTWKFDPYRQSKISGQYVSAFAYISTIVFNACVATINSQKKEQEKIKEDFRETQKMFHNDPKKSTIIPDHSEVGLEVVLNNIPGTLLTEIKKIPIVTDDIMVKYNPDYKISIDEYNLINEYTSKNNITMSIVRNCTKC
jgi:hypothetical protein